MRTDRTLAGKAGYAILFLVALPVTLWQWAHYSSPLVRFQSVESVSWGLTISIAGGLLMVWAMWVLTKVGKGLPMNAYPPVHFVKEGPYRLVRHPIYWGFGILLIGISVMTGSAGGFWLVTPLTILGILALVWGYESIDLGQRFPSEEINALLDIPGQGSERAGIRNRFAALFWTVSILFLGNYLVWLLKGSTPALFGQSWDVHSAFSGWYGQSLSLLFIAGTPFVLRRMNQIREWVISSLAGVALLIYISLLWPSVGAQYFAPEFSSVYSDQRGLVAFSTVPLFLILISLRAYLRQIGKLSFPLLFLATVIGFYQVANSWSAILHLLVAMFVFIVSTSLYPIWKFLKELSEKIANSWDEWIFGPVRILNRGIYTGLSALLSFLLAGWLAGDAYGWALLVFLLISLACAALWAQLIEGSEKLNRPFGYYGALVGTAFASLAIGIMGYNVWVVIAVVSVVMPWAQAIGRLGCLVNGCCHGGPAQSSEIGIRYFHWRSRVTNISGLKGELLYPTQLYSIIWLFFIGFLLLALWNNEYPYPFIFGLYLILTGIGRFVEEAYRGEIQTPVIGGLRLYQWTAIASVLAGIPMTVIPVQPALIEPGGGWQLLIVSVLGGLAVFFAMGVDFPDSNRRFSRLV